MLYISFCRIPSLIFVEKYVGRVHLLAAQGWLKKEVSPGVRKQFQQMEFELLEFHSLEFRLSEFQLGIPALLESPHEAY